MDNAAFTLAADSAKEIVKYSTAILTVTITFAKDTLLADRKTVPWCLGTAWMFYLLSILGGLWTLLALTGQLASASSTPGTLFAPNIQIPGLLMVLSFVLGLVLTVVAGWQSVRRIGVLVDAAADAAPVPHQTEGAPIPDGLPTQEQAPPDRGVQTDA